MHTFELSCSITDTAYSYLAENLSSLSQPSKHIKRTNYYSKKGIDQIELRKFRKETNGMVLWESYYLVIRCNPSIILGESKVFLLDLDNYTVDILINGIKKRLYEINEFRYIGLHNLSIDKFHLRRFDVAKDIFVDDPEIIVWICNMSFPYGHCNMRRKLIDKETEILYRESCYFLSKSRTFNLYYKKAELINNGKKFLPNEEARINKTVRIEVQIKKSGVTYLSGKLHTKKSVVPFLRKDFRDNYLEKEIYSLFRIEKYVSRSKAEEIINSSNFNTNTKMVMLSIIDMIQSLGGLYELEKAISDPNIPTPLYYGNLRTFRERWLKKIRSLGIQPIVIPNIFGIDEIPSIYDLLTNNEGVFLYE